MLLKKIPWRGSRFRVGLVGGWDLTKPLGYTAAPEQFHLLAMRVLVAVLDRRGDHVLFGYISLQPLFDFRKLGIVSSIDVLVWIVAVIVQFLRTIAVSNVSPSRPTYRVVVVVPRRDGGSGSPRVGVVELRKKRFAFETSDGWEVAKLQQKEEQDSDV